MHTIILSILMVTAFAVLPSSAPAQQQESMMDSDMSAMMGEGMGGGMGMDMDMGMTGACGMQGYGMGMGMMDGRGKGQDMMGLGPIWMLDLNADQRAKLTKIQLDLRKQLWALKGKTFDNQAQLHQLYSAERPDSKKIGAVYTSIFDVKRQMIEAKIEAMNRAREILNKEQLDKLKQMQQHGGMMGAGRMEHHRR